MFRRLFMNRMRRRSGLGYGSPYRRRSYGGFPFATMLVVVCLVVLLVLYWQGYLDL